jgi:hypothetical protein
MTTRSLLFPRLGLLLGTAALLLSTGGCGGKKEVVPVPVGEVERYTDPVLRFSIEHPKAWLPDIEAGRRARFFSAEGVKERFLDPTGPYPDGAMIGLDVYRTSVPDSVRDAHLSEMKSQGYVLGEPAQLTISEAPATRVRYTANYGGGIMAHGDMVFVNADSVTYELTMAGFGDLFEAHQAVFDTALHSFRLPAPVIPGRDPTLPSETAAGYDGKLIAFSYPDNFNFETTRDSVISLRGARQDCSIRFDIFPAQGLTAEKVMEQNIGKFRVTSRGTSKIGGVTAPSFTYAATRDVERRFSFAVKNDLVYRVTLDWYRPQRSEYLAAYENVLQSVRFK